MNQDFWIERWHTRQIGFHQQEINPYLLEYWPALNLAAHSRVFVPLCGKSKDMLWLAEQGHEVTGIELSPLAVEEFFSDNNLQPQQQECGGMTCYRAGNISIFLGDIFQLNTDMLGEIAGVYDRASIVALPPELRKQYTTHLATLVPNSEMLLVAMDYDQNLMQGPPFSVNDVEITQHFSNTYKISKLQSTDLARSAPHFRQKGLQTLLENVYRLSPL